MPNAVVGWLKRTVAGPAIQPSYVVAEWLFLRALGTIYLIAFTSFGVQCTGLVGSRGILPLDHYLDAVHRALGSSGFWQMPTLFWFNHSDRALTWLSIAGAAAAILIMLGLPKAIERVALTAAYVLYLSICTAGQEFMSFQWDILLLEAGFLSIFLGGSSLIVWLFRWLLFRLMFLSGVVKLTSHDPTWRNLTAMHFHYETQPLPTPLAWYAEQLPLSFQKFSTAMVFVIELGIPFLIFGPRRLRIFAACSIVFLQVLIFLTGNYTFFNLLAIALCMFLLDDSLLPKLRLRAVSATPRPAAIAIAVLILALSITEVSAVLFNYEPPVGAQLVRLAAPFDIVNTYGLFAVMTTHRPEIIVQGSNDGVAWTDYAFKFKPGDLQRAPHWVAPYQPRLDWQMWFAALGNYRSNPWFVNFMVRLLEGSPDVTDQLAASPFPHSPPRYVRALLFEYHFTDFDTWRRTHQWWSREPRGLYFPAISLQDIRRSD